MEQREILHLLSKFFINIVLINVNFNENSIVQHMIYEILFVEAISLSLRVVMMKSIKYHYFQTLILIILHKTNLIKIQSHLKIMLSKVQSII